MFSIARFREVTGNYPDKITVVSFSFKRRRFETLHAPALRWPADKFAYVGVDPPASTGFDLKRSTEGELQNAAAPFEKDPYGCHSQVLQEKRKGRNPFHRTPPYVRTKLKRSLSHCQILIAFCSLGLFISVTSFCNFRLGSILPRNERSLELLWARTRSFGPSSMGQ